MLTHVNLQLGVMDRIICKGGWREYLHRGVMDAFCFGQDKSCTHKSSAKADMSTRAIPRSKPNTPCSSCRCEVRDCSTSRLVWKGMNFSEVLGSSFAQQNADRSDRPPLASVSATDTDDFAWTTHPLNSSAPGPCGRSRSGLRRSGRPSWLGWYSGSWAEYNNYSGNSQAYHYLIHLIASLWHPINVL